MIVFGILIIIFSVVLGLIILIQNPKGGGLAGSLSGFGNQLMGVKQSTDVLEKGTWIFAAIIGLLCLMSPAFIDKDGSSSTANDALINNTPTTVPKTNTPAAPATTTPMPGTVDTSK
ncbi:MAG TPA: preprotein translocase subunit SecG [Ferruginibacter sp.]|nr:preprotein translocase subunit SecG [Ferruginibacter sp.]